MQHSVTATLYVFLTSYFGVNETFWVATAPCISFSMWEFSISFFRDRGSNNDFLDLRETIPPNHDSHSELLWSKKCVPNKENQWTRDTWCSWEMAHIYISCIAVAPVGLWSPDCGKQFTLVQIKAEGVFTGIRGISLKPLIAVCVQFWSHLTRASLFHMI